MDDQRTRRFRHTASWRGDRADEDEGPYDARDYYGDTFRGRYPPTAHRYDRDRYDSSRWAREEPHGSSHGRSVDPERPRYRRWRELGPVGRRDQRLVDAVCRAIAAPPEVTVEVEDGVVWLYGAVADRGARRKAERRAARVRGVREVHNRLRISS